MISEESADLQATIEQTDSGQQQYVLRALCDHLSGIREELSGIRTLLEAGHAASEAMRGQAPLALASRPSELDFVADGDECGLRGVVSRKSFLGEIIDYQVKIGDQEVRVQKGRRDPGPEAGEACCLKLARPFWYAGEE